MRFATSIASPILQRALKCVLIAAIGLHAIGMPMPVGVWKDLSNPFPCQFRSCGCQSAESCWRSCCCFTDAEKLAWAAKNGVTPPQSVRERVAAAAKRTPLVEKQPSTCCVAKTQPAAASAKTACATASKSCCSSNNQAPAPTKKQYEAISISEYRNCRGLDNGLLKLPPVLVPAPNDVVVGAPLCEAPNSFKNYFSSRPLPPPTPPPERSIAIA